ncbi:MAG: hypothetical protein V4673_04495 [Pseudomonadota bacterium]
MRSAFRHSDRRWLHRRVASAGGHGRDSRNSYPSPAHDDADRGPERRSIAAARNASAARYRIDRTGIHALNHAHRRAYSNSSAVAGLTSLETAWFSSVMTQRSIPHPQHAPAHRAARAHAGAAHAKRIDTAVINVALASLVLVVVVLITNTTGAG